MKLKHTFLAAMLLSPLTLAATTSGQMDVSRQESTQRADSAQQNLQQQAGQWGLSADDFLKADAKKRGDAGELTDRVRVVYEVPGRGYQSQSVTVQDRDHWIARLDVVADEYFHAEPVKRALVRYPLKVVRWEGDAERNPFGLALDCYAGVPQRLEAAPPAPKPEKSGVFQ